MKKIIMPVTIAFAEDKAVNRNSFLQKVREYSDLSVVFGATDGHDFLEQLKQMPFTKHPQVAFIDLEMPQLDGIQTIRLGKVLYPHIAFIVLTVFDDDEKIYEAIRAGASGYLLKDENAEAIRRAITNVLEDGGAAMSPAIARKAFELLNNAALAVKKSNTGSEMDTILSQREKEILLHTIKGYGASQVAEILHISVLTVRRHIANIYAKLHVNSKAQILHLAHKRKWF
jgi:DNA-binding NarL/FixJ family response regulator